MAATIAVGASLAIEQAQGGQSPFFARIGARGLDHDAPRRQACTDSGYLESGPAQRAGRDVLGSRDMADAAVAQACEMFHGQPHSRFVVGNHRRQSPAGVGAVDQNHR